MTNPFRYTPKTNWNAAAAKGARSNALLTYWNALRFGDGLPRWSDFDLMALYKIAPFIAVFDVEGSSALPIFRYRFVGTFLVDTRNRITLNDPTGMLYDEIPREYDSSLILETYRKCVADAAPALIWGSFLPYREYGYGERLIAPLSKTGERVDMLITCLDRLEESDIPAG